MDAPIKRRIRSLKISIMACRALERAVALLASALVYENPCKLHGAAKAFLHAAFRPLR
jgi:hypothetical protein